MKMTRGKCGFCRSNKMQINDFQPGGDAINCQAVARRRQRERTGEQGRHGNEFSHLLANLLQAVEPLPLLLPAMHQISPRIIQLAPLYNWCWQAACITMGNDYAKRRSPVQIPSRYPSYLPQSASVEEFWNVYLCANRFCLLLCLPRLACSARLFSCRVVAVAHYYS